jgi:hypothetical protein
VPQLQPGLIEEERLVEAALRISMQQASAPSLGGPPPLVRNQEKRFDGTIVFIQKG